MTADGMDLYYLAEGDQVRIVLRGELHSDTVGQLEQTAASALSGPGVARLELDMRLVTYAESSALRCLLGIRRDAQRAGVELVLVRPMMDWVMRIFDVSGLSDYFAFTPDPGALPTS